MRKRIFEVVNRFKNGEPLISRDVDWSRVSTEQLTMPKSELWQNLGKEATPTR